MCDEAMTTPMPPERLEELEKLCDAATHGPWAWDCVDSLQLGMDGIVNRANKTVVFCNSGRGSGSPTDEDAEFMIESRMAVPELIREVERQRDEIIDWLEDHLTVSMEVTELDGERWWDSMSRFSYIGDELVELGVWEKHPTAGVGGRQYYRKLESKP